MKTHDSSALLWSCVLRVILMHPSRSKQIPLPPPSEHTSLSLVVNASSLKSKSARFHSLLPQRTLEASPPPAYLPPMHPYCNERIHANISNCCRVLPKGYCEAGPPPAYLPPMHPYCDERIHANISNCCHVLPKGYCEAGPPPAYLLPMHPYCNERIHANISNCCHVFPKGYCGAGPPPPPPANPQLANLYLP